MNGFLKRALLPVLALSVLFTMGCASTSTQSATGEYVDDSVITTKVKADMLGDPDLKSTQINVETYKGVVQLSGFVHSQTMIDRAVVVAQAVPGVKSVKNDMRVR